jgi:hypothetical protein
MLRLDTGHGGPQSLVCDEDLLTYLHVDPDDLDVMAAAVPHIRASNGQRIYTADRVYAYFNAVPVPAAGGTGE